VGGRSTKTLRNAQKTAKNTTMGGTEKKGYGGKGDRGENLPLAHNPSTFGCCAQTERKANAKKGVATPTPRRLELSLDTSGEQSASPGGHRKKMNCSWDLPARVGCGSQKRLKTRSGEKCVEGGGDTNSAKGQFPEKRMEKPVNLGLGIKEIESQPNIAAR